MRLCLIGMFLFCYLHEAWAESGLYAFDWDDNVVNMPMHMQVLNSKTGKIEILSPFYYVSIYQNAPGFEHYSLPEDAFHYYHDDPTGQENYFLNDIKTVLSDPTDKWKGPEWDHFVKVLSDPETASHALIITAREQSSHIIRAGLLHLQEKGIIKYVLPEENIWAVNHPKFYEMIQERMKTTKRPKEYPVDDPNHDSARKFFVINYYLNQLVTDQFDGNEAVHNSSFMSKRIYDQTFHFWYFSDDCEANIATAKEMILQKLEESHHWKNLRLELHYTSSPKAVHPPYRMFVAPQ